MKPWSDQEARWIRRAAEDVIRERRPPGREFSAREDREVNRLMVNHRLAGGARELETDRTSTVNWSARRQPLSPEYRPRGIREGHERQAAANAPGLMEEKANTT